MHDPSKPPLLSVSDVSKRYSGVKALDQVDLTLHEGEVLAVIGENGAGKSTLMKILAGVIRGDQGQIIFQGKPVQIDSVRQATELGIALIHQELNLADNLDVGANIFLGREPRRGLFIDDVAIRRRAKGVLERVGLEVEPTQQVSTLSIGRQQLVEIAKALSADAKILIMDEPTSSLSQEETKRLFRVIKELSSQGVGVIYISHRLAEVKEIADRVVVLRDGKNAGQLKRDAIGHDAMVRLMVGRDITQFYNRTRHATEKTRLSVKGLRTIAHPRKELNFHVREGEIVGVAGLMGAGRTEMLRSLFGVDRPLAGEILIDGKIKQFRDSRHAIAEGVFLAPEDRKSEGLVVDMSVQENISLPGLRRHRLAGGFVNRVREKEDALSMIDRLRIKTPDENQIVRFLSGGNQQKVVLGKWLALAPRVLLLDEPTRGVDIGAKQEIYAVMEKMAEQGVAILFASSDLEEIIGMADRALVMHEGRISGELSREQFSEEAIMLLATGHAAAAI